MCAIEVKVYTQIYIYKYIKELAVQANFILPENVSLANDYTMLQKAYIVSIVCQKAP